MAWANTTARFYVKQDPETLRWGRVLAHELGRLKDAEVYFEADETFEVSLSRSNTEKYIFLRSGSTLSTEYRLIDAGKPAAAPALFQARQPKLEYDVEDGGDRFYVLNNWDARNFKVSVCPSSATSRSSWTELVPHREDTLVEYIDVFENWLVLQERSKAQGGFNVFDRSAGSDSRITFDEPAYMPDLGDNYEYRTGTLRVTYESLTTPDSVYDVDLKSGGKRLMKRQEVVGGFKPEDYKAERLWFTARDGEKVPVSLVYKKSVDLGSGKNPLHIYSYGSYGYSSDPYFSSARLSLLDRGFICAIPHIRGGSELGRRWYEEGRQLKKKNTFYDFIDATRYLIGLGYTSPAHIYAEGAPPGGLVGPVQYGPGALPRHHSGVPFVDVLPRCWTRTSRLPPPSMTSGATRT